MKIIRASVIFAFLILQPTLHADAMLSSKSIIVKCQAAYDALNSFKCHVTVDNSNTDGVERHTTADVVFLRPGDLRVDGTDSQGNPYSYFTDGKTTMDYINGEWETDDNIGLAIAGATGISLSAATYVPAVLIHSKDWGDPFRPREQVDPKYAIDSVGSNPCYKIEVHGRVETTLWIDMKTLLLDRIDTSFLGMDDEQLITSQVINSPINFSFFAKSGK